MRGAAVTGLDSVCHPPRWREEPRRPASTEKGGSEGRMVREWGVGRVWSVGRVVRVWSVGRSECVESVEGVECVPCVERE